jgi:flagellin-like hook-associated protein FlgL
MRQIQLSTGKVGQYHSAVGSAISPLVTSEGVITRLNAYESAANQALARFQVQESALVSLEESASTLRAGIVRALANGAGDFLSLEAEGTAGRALSALNTSLGGVYVFGGSNGAEPPVNARSLADLVGVNLANLFADAPAQRIAISDGRTVSGGPMAEDVGTGLLTSLQAFAEAEATLGPFDGQLTDAQRDFLREQLRALDGVIDRVITAQGLNGGLQTEASGAVAEHSRARDLAEILVSEIEDADIAEVISKLSQDQIAIEAAGRALAQVGQLSLLDFI